MPVCWISRRGLSGYTFATKSYCADVYSVLAYFCSEYSRVAHVRRQAGQVRSGHRQRVYVAVFMTRVVAISCSRSTVTVAAPARLRPLSHAMPWCVKTYSRQAVCSES